jgi:hypothetical protein
MRVGALRRVPFARGAREIVLLQQVWLVHFLDRAGFLADRHGQALMRLPKGYLAQNADPVRSPVVQLKDRQPNTDATTKSTGSKVLQFRSRNSEKIAPERAQDTSGARTPRR